MQSHAVEYAARLGLGLRLASISFREARPRPRSVLLVDGRSGSGKSTFAERARLLLGGAVVHTDDLAWHHDAVAWDDLALTHVIEPWRRGEDVDYRPPAWVARGREGSVRVPENARVLVLEGVGAGRASLAAHADAVVWVQSDRHEARERGLRRDVELGRTPAEAEEFWDGWMAAEEPFLADDRPWDRADLVVNTSSRDEPADRMADGTTLALRPRAGEAGGLISLRPCRAGRSTRGSAPRR